MRETLSRRTVLQGAFALVIAKEGYAMEAAAAKAEVQTVRGRIPANKMGFTLPHEHVLCDFIGADKTGKHRWNSEEVAETMRPYLERIKKRGVQTFVDCTPAYIGRDPALLKRLSEATGLHFLTNTGYYGAAGDKFLPKHAFTETAEQLAARWIREWKEGIEETGIRPGFIKVGVDPAEGTPAKLSEVDAKIVRAAAIACKATGLTVACHTGQGLAMLEELKIWAEEKANPSKLIYVHADGEASSYHQKVAEQGAWVEFDAAGWRPAEDYLKILVPLLPKYADRILLSMDSGWYWAGEPKGGKINHYDHLTENLLPTLKKAGVEEKMIAKLTVENPMKALTLSAL